ncbi:hypothetical protein GY21_01610 [Cryobacterium roopkundense]|uniref:Glycosyl transferase family 11 n=1 Tax=Cryobacterium roopkundense TaxID=1001240 RepID=A0A099JWK9_9MICO|nr:alpha-1,2-fucosyltransferase [Cryobacterium roopkundense]KGJ81793.1 hypothetical protein GY21_01610 [Cryobacterium roopkundense]MBB5642390.1 hypothetical protein [Cryobacterium roopkundense]
MANVVGLIGGLGNQLFQYSFGRWLEMRTGTPTQFDLSAYRGRPDYLGLAEFGFNLGKPLKSVSKLPFPGGRFPRAARGVRQIIGPARVRFERELHGLPSALQMTKRSWYYGYWQHPHMVREVLGSLQADFEARTVGDNLPTTRIAVHVRRGDMVVHSAILGPDYYARAVRELREAHRLPASEPVTIFSDDPQWCRDNLELPTAQYPEPLTAAGDLAALAQHEFLVLSGSTFSWWAASLTHRAPDSVVAPDPFVPRQKLPLDMEGWLAVSR